MSSTVTRKGKGADFQYLKHLKFKGFSYGIPGLHTIQHFGATFAILFKHAKC
jgi:hypothetical protein